MSVWFFESIKLMHEYSSVLIYSLPLLGSGFSSQSFGELLQQSSAGVDQGNPEPVVIFGWTEGIS